MRVLQLLRRIDPRRLATKWRSRPKEENALADDFLIARLHQIIYRSLPPRPWRHPLDPVAALDELRAWIDDEHQWHADTSLRNWRSLLEDVASSFAELPHVTKTRISSRTADPLNEIGKARGSLTQGGKVNLTPGLRRQLDGAEVALRTLLLEPETLTAAWADLARAVKRSDLRREDQALALLAAVADVQGRPWEPLRKQLWRVLGDEDLEISKLAAELAGQAEPAPGREPQRAGLAPAERLDLAERLLQLPPASGELVVWLAFLEASVPSLVLHVGTAVTLSDGRWLVDVLEHWDPRSPNATEVPAEASSHRGECLECWKPSGQQLEDRPFALVRIALGHGVISEAVGEARATVDVLLALASLYSGGRVSWRDAESFIVFVDGRPQWRTAGLEDLHPERGMNLSLAQDHTAHILQELEPTIGRHVPITDPEIEAAIDPLRWFLEAQQTWTPAKFLLCDRILEQVSGWARETDSSTFARKYLALPWAWDQISSDIAEAVRKGIHGIERGGFYPTDPARRAAYLEAVGPKGLEERGPGMKLTYNCRGGLAELDWLRSWQRPGTDGAVELDTLKKRLGTARAALRDFRDRQTEFNELLERAQRTRNVVAHGGPIAPATLQSVGRFFEEVAADALNEALHARLEGRDVAQHFASRQSDQEQRVENLRNGMAPSDALFPP